MARESFLLSACKLAKYTVGIVLLAVLRNCVQKAEQTPAGLTEEDLQKRLTAASVTYHLIGILYNE